MQSQAHISGQASGEAGGQLPGLTQQNGSSLQSQASNVGGLRRPWHADSDLIGGRELMCNKIFKLLQVWQQRKPMANPQSQHRMPEFARRLEEFLFNDAASKEEYMDYRTIDRRIQELFRKYTQQPKLSKNCSQGFVPHVGDQHGNLSQKVSSIVDNMICSICFNKWHDVMSVTPCLSNICNACILQLYKRAGEKGIKLICPQCESDVYSVGRNHSLRNIVECLMQDLLKYNSLLQSSTEDSSQLDKYAIVQSAIVSSIEENMTCSICLNIWHDVVSVTPCLHNFCNACFSQLYKRAGEKGIKLICPQCRSDIYSVGRNHSLRNIVECLMQDLLKYNSLVQSSTEDRSQLDKFAIVQSDIMIIGKTGPRRSAFAESSGSGEREFE